MGVCSLLSSTDPRIRSVDEVLIASTEKVLLQRLFSPDRSLLSLAQNKQH